MGGSVPSKNHCLSPVFDINGLEPAENPNHLCAMQENSAYHVYAGEAGIDYRVRYPYIIYGGPITAWPVFVSAVPANFAPLMAAVLPVILEEGVCFAMPIDRVTHCRLLEGKLGWAEVGKVLVVYCRDRKNATAIAARFGEITNPFKCPAVPLHPWAGGAVYLGFRHKKQTVKQVAWRYLAVTVIKNDVKGRVIKCIDVLWPFRWLLLKEGRHDTCMDERGRAIEDRLRWQYKVQKKLLTAKLSPAPYRFFSWRCNTWFAMEYVQGESLHQAAARLYGNRHPVSLSANENTTVLRYMLEVLAMSEKLHNSGLVHRDLTPHNFLVRPCGSLAFIDLELSYDTETGQPMPPFALGSPGYMSPEQQACKLPSFAEDTYALGGMLLSLLGGISPTRIDIRCAERLERNCRFFTGNALTGSLAAACLSAAPAGRPPASQVRQDLLSATPPLLPKAESFDIIQEALDCLCSAKFTDAEETWFAKQEPGHHAAANESARYIASPGIFNGIAGIIYTLSVAKNNGYTINADMAAKNLSLLFRHKKQTGLFYGSYGAVIAAAGQNWLPPGNSRQQAISDWLQQPPRGAGLASGLAGQGFAALHALPYPNAERQLETIAGEICTKLPAAQGLFEGRAGVACFLLAYGEKYKDKAAIGKACHLLDKLLCENYRSAWLEDGITGIAYSCLQAYKAAGDKAFADAACGLLQLHPKYITANVLDIGNGLSGIGEVYLEAWWLLKDIEWLERARWIEQVICHLYFETVDQKVFWLNDESLSPEPGLFRGNGGIIHFLMRCRHPDNIGFPVLNTAV